MATSKDDLTLEAIRKAAQKAKGETDRKKAANLLAQVVEQHEDFVTDLQARQEAANELSDGIETLTAVVVGREPDRKPAVQPHPIATAGTEAVYAVVERVGPVSRGEIARQLGVSPEQVGARLTALKDQGRIEKEGDRAQAKWKVA
jgi:predicted Rossmann fold nucleotide-binding protein DprA/Smf involved in DNA uptake